MTPEQKKQIRQQNESWAAGGLRVLAVAYRPLEQMQACSLELEDSCIFLGIAAMLDPPRPESKPADGKKGGHPSGHDHGRSSGDGPGGGRKDRNSGGR